MLPRRPDGNPGGGEFYALVERPPERGPALVDTEAELRGTSTSLEATPAGGAGTVRLSEEAELEEDHQPLEGDTVGVCRARSPSGSTPR